MARHSAKLSIMPLKAHLRRLLPRRLLLFSRFLRSPNDIAAARKFVLSPSVGSSLAQRIQLVGQCYSISDQIPSPHTQAEILWFMQAILSIPRDAPGCIVEAGAYKVSSTAKFSLAARAVGRKLYVFDSFAGIPPNDEPHEKSTTGYDVSFPAGSYCGTLEEVKANIARCGAPEVCEFVPGWFEDTLPNFREPVAAAYIDVDLANSTRTCLKYLYPLLQPGAALYSQDGHLPLVIEVFRDTSLWGELGTEPLEVDGLGVSKLLRLVKPQLLAAPAWTA